MFLGFALVAWFFLMPPLESMQTFEAWWITLIFVATSH